MSFIVDVAVHTYFRITENDFIRLVNSVVTVSAKFTTLSRYFGSAESKNVARFAFSNRFQKIRQLIIFIAYRVI